MVQYCIAQFQTHMHHIRSIVFSLVKLVYSTIFLKSLEFKHIKINKKIIYHKMHVGFKIGNIEIKTKFEIQVKNLYIFLY